MIDTPGWQVQGSSETIEIHSPNQEMALVVSSELHSIGSNITNTLIELDVIYNQIGYAPSDISSKKQDIFVVIQNTIANFTSNLQREKNNIENECEWIRQQVQITLAMMNDLTGTQLELTDRRIIFDGEGPACTSSPIESACNFSLLQLKRRLNTIFLNVLKDFMEIFKKYITLTLTCLHNKELIGEYPQVNEPVTSLPSKEEAEEYKLLIDQFELSLKYLNDSDGPFIIPSPSKVKKLEEASSPDDMANIRDINNQIIQVIRTLKLTKITPEVLQSIQHEIDYTNKELKIRQEKMCNLIGTILNLINVLHFTDGQLIDIQKEGNDAAEGFFDVDTLKFIQSNPNHFGLHESHINYFQTFFNHLRNIKEDRQKKYDNYSMSCKDLWHKLGEDSLYVDLFLSANDSLTDATILNFKMELNKLYRKRSEFIENFIADSRRQIESLYNQIYVSEEERKCFKHFEYDISDPTDKETILLEHELELTRLNELLNMRNPGLHLYKQLNQLLQDQIFLKESSKDSSRLLSKNSCKILLHEEKVRKKISKNLPRLISTLKSWIVEYNSLNSLMTINGEDFLKLVLTTESEQTSTAVVRTRRQQPIKRTAPIPTVVAQRSSSETKRRARQTAVSPPTKMAQKICKAPALVRRIPDRSHAITLTSSFSTVSGTSSLLETPSLGSTLGQSLGSLTPKFTLESPISFKTSTGLFKANRQLNSREPLNTADKNNLNRGLKISAGLNQSQGQENSSPIVSKNFEVLSPIRYIPSRRVSTSTIGDDYHDWRVKKIKLLNQDFVVHSDKHLRM